MGLTAVSLVQTAALNGNMVSDNELEGSGCGLI
jgi:hypothetical protein